MPVSVRVRTCSSAAELQRSLEIYNEVWPHARRHRARTSTRGSAAAIASVEFLGAVDGVDAGSAAAALEASRTQPRRDARDGARRNTGAPASARALVEAVTSWAAEQGARELETRVEADDAESLEFALRRGFHEHSREDGLELSCADVEPRDGRPPAGVEIVTLAERPDLARGVYDVAAEALPDVPGQRGLAAASVRAVRRCASARSRDLRRGRRRRGDRLREARRPARRSHCGSRDDGGQARMAQAAASRRALKRAQIAWAKANGIERLTASNEERNAPMQHINSLLGYRLVPGRVRLRAASADSSLR